MNKDSEFWKVPLSDHEKNHLDLELLDELNENYEDEEESEVTYNSFFKDLAIKVVGIITAFVFILIVSGNLFQFFSYPALDFLAKSRELAEDPEISQLRESVVVVNAMGSKGTGFNISPTGLIVTNYHVISNSRVVYVNFIDRDIYHVKEIESFPEVDLAILKIDGEDIPVIELEMEETSKIGDEVLVIGNPLGFTRIINKGVITGRTRLKGWNEEVLMIEGAIHKGSSGSPVFNDNGKVIAVVFATLGSNTDSDNTIGLAVPIKHLLEKLSSHQ